MKNFLILCSVIILNISISFAQQKIKDGSLKSGNLTYKDAILELESLNKGLLHARVSLVESTEPSPLTSHVAGMMVYNIATNKDVVPGIYYNDGHKWVSVKGVKGDIGTQGSMGLTGATGPQGMPGKDGEPGRKGDTGRQGPMGLTGATGPQGLAGKDGQTGPAGKDGDVGIQGPTGFTGATGPQGVAGKDGQMGPAGKDGDVGIQGPMGLMGATGPQGVAGKDGDTGMQGPMGLTGATGPQGVAGKDGEPGRKGDTGMQGPMGLTGATGPHGIQGGIGLIEAGINTSVTGNGVEEDPYKINTPTTALVQDKSTGMIVYTNEAAKVQTAELKGSAKDNLLKIDVNGGLYISADDVIPAAKVKNGLTAIAGIIQLGGKLIQPTILATDADNTLALVGLQQGSSSDKIIVTDINGVLKTITPDVLNNNWALNGNDLTNSTFMGSNNNFDLVFKRNGKRSGLISVMGSTSFGENALSNEPLNADNITLNSSGSTAFGYRALTSNTTGNGNTGVGLFALADNTSGDRNTAIGNRAFWGGRGNGNTVMGADAMIGRYTQSNFSTGNYNTAIGTESAGLLRTGDNNTAIGYYSLHWTNDGKNNVGIGTSAGATNWTGSNNTFVGTGADATIVKRDVNKSAAIGYNAKVEADNSMTLGGTGADAISVGIGVTAPNSTLQIQGSMSTAIKLISADYTVTEKDFTLIFTVGGLKVSLPDPTTCKGRMYRLVNAGDPSQGPSAKDIAFNQGVRVFNTPVSPKAAGLIETSRVMGISQGFFTSLEPTAVMKLNNSAIQNTILIQSDGIEWWRVGL